MEMSKEMSKTKTAILNEYYSDNAKKLRRIVDKLLKKNNWDNLKDCEKFYSLANEVFHNVINGFDESKGIKFSTYLITALHNKICSEITAMNRIKRSADTSSISIDEDIDEMGHSLLDIYAADNDVAEDFMANELSPEMEDYLSLLNKKERKILLMLAAGYKLSEIIETMNISKIQYYEALQHLKCHDYVKVLNGKTSRIKSIEAVETKFNTENNIKENTKTNINQEEKNNMESYISTTLSTHKREVYPLSSVIRMLMKYEWRDDHPLQRCSNQWAKQTMYDCVSAVLNNFPLPDVITAEQVFENHTAAIWLLDGKQRLTTLCAYRNNEFKLGKNTDRPIIRYSLTTRNDDGTKTTQPMEYDIRGKKFKDLPSELQERYNDYLINTTQYLACSQDDVEYHIRRYNNCKAMSTSQKSITYLGSELAVVTKKLAKCDFFKEKCSLKKGEFNNSTIDRIILDTVMMTFYRDEWKKQQNEMGAFLKTNAKTTQLDKVEEACSRLEAVMEDNTEVLNSKNVAYVLSAFINYIDNNNGTDEQFAENIIAALTSDEFSELTSAGQTRDKKMVNRKLDYIANYLGMATEEVELCELEYNYVEDFTTDIIADVTNNKKEVYSLFRNTLKALYGNSETYSEEEYADMLLYMESFNDYVMNYVATTDNVKKVLNKNNIPMFIKSVQYSFENDIEEKHYSEWLNLYLDNYENINKPELMLDDLARYVGYKTNDNNTAVDTVEETVRNVENVKETKEETMVSEIDSNKNDNIGNTVESIESNSSIININKVLRQMQENMINS